MVKPHERNGQYSAPVLKFGRRKYTVLSPSDAALLQNARVAIDGYVQLLPKKSTNSPLCRDYTWQSNFEALYLHANSIENRGLAYTAKEVIDALYTIRSWHYYEFVDSERARLEMEIVWLENENRQIITSAEIASIPFRMYQYRQTYEEQMSERNE